MRQRLVKLFLVVSIASMAWPVTFICSMASPQPIFTIPSSEEASLRIFLQKFVGEPLSETEREMRYMNAWTDLDGDGKKEAIVYLLGWCGSGGCSTLILHSDDASYRVVTYIKIAQLPIGKLSTTSHGWHNLTVRKYGGGIQKPYKAKLQFDGTTYSISPARYFNSTEKEEVLIPDNMDKAKPLYP
jgi:hypothetical protein